MLLNFWRLLRVPWTARRSNQSLLKEISLGVHWKDWWWNSNSNTLATSCEELTHWKRHWCWEGLRAGGKGDDRGWDGWMASPTRWTWVWVDSGSWWRSHAREAWRAVVHGVAESDTTERLNWNDSKEYWGFPSVPVVRNSSAKAGDTGLIPGPGRSHKP